MMSSLKSNSLLSLRIEVVGWTQKAKDKIPDLEVHTPLLNSLKGPRAELQCPTTHTPSSQMFPHGPQVLTLLLCRYKVNETNSDREVTWSLFIKHLLCARY